MENTDKYSAAADDYITEILLKLALNTIILNLNPYSRKVASFFFKYNIHVLASEWLQSCVVLVKNENGRWELAIWHTPQTTTRGRIMVLRVTRHIVTPVGFIDALAFCGYESVKTVNRRVDIIAPESQEIHQTFTVIIA